jgi:hypothetical protein
MTRRMLFSALVACLGALHCTPTTAIAETLTTQGLAPVRLGMTIAIAERALHAKLGRLSRSSHGFSTEPESVEICWLWRRRDGQRPDIVYMAERGRIVRIDITAADGAKATSVTTARGIGVGSPLGDVEKAYGADLHLEPHPLDEPIQWGVVERAGTAGIRIEVNEGIVSAMFAAIGPPLDYSEGCS